MRKTLKIKTRLLITVGFVAAMLAAVSGVGLWRLGAIERGVDQVTRGDARVAGEMAQFVLSVGDLVQHERGYLVNASRSQPTAADLQAWKTAYTSGMQRLTEIDTVPDARASVISMRNAMRAYDTENGIGSGHFDQVLNAVMLLAYVALRQGDAVGALTFGTPPGQARSFAPRKGARALNALGRLSIRDSGERYPERRAALEESLTIFRDLGDLDGSAEALNHAMERRIFVQRAMNS